MPPGSSASAPRGSLVAAAFVAAALVAACGAPAASETPEPTERPTTAPIATPTTMAGGPLSGEGPLGRATYQTPTAFTPTFSFDLRADGWRSIVNPDEFGFVLATPNAVNVDALIGVVTPTATSIEQFSGELANTGFLDGTETVSDVTIDGISARSFSIRRSTPNDAFTIHTPNGFVQTSFGGELADNRILYVAHPDKPFALLLNAKADADVEIRFVFDALVDSIDFP
jgi:hypothetical protein